MKKMTLDIEKTDIDGVVIIKPKVYYDDRGYFFESWKWLDYRRQVLDTQWIQENESKSCYGVLRGLHYQKEPFAQAKLVRVVKGQVLDVAVDIRKESPTFGKYVSVILNDENKKQFLIPRGFAHGFVVLSDEVIFQYKVDNVWNKESERGIAWNDLDLNIDWKVPTKDIILSQKDKVHPILKNIPDKDLFHF